MKKKLMLGILLAIVCFSFTGCFASWGNEKALKGGYFSNNTGDYIVLNESGGEIMDCWILKNTYVESETSSDGLRFVDPSGNGIIVQGDAKIIRVNNEIDSKQYIEYHKDTDLISYEEFYKEHIK